MGEVERLGADFAPRALDSKPAGRYPVRRPMASREFVARSSARPPAVSGTLPLRVLDGQRQQSPRCG